ncbi:MAG TPA: VWA domain-containing protein [Bryobacteraceae bacterium]|jgi:VWFA-related protein
MRKLYAVAALLAVQVGAQTPAPKKEADASMPTFRSNTHLVQVNVIVRQHGKPVSDLKKEDFRLYDNGKQQPLSVFSVEASNGALPASPVKLPPGVYTNKLTAKPGTPQSVTVILLDMFNLRVQDQMFARQQVIRYLKTIRPEDRVGIYLLGNSLKVLHDYTTDSTDLLRALNAFGDGKTLPDLSQDQKMSFGTDMITLNNWMMTGGTGAERDMYMIQRVTGTLKVIEFIANHLASLPGRKNLIWVSGGFPMQIGFNSIREMTDPSREQRDFGQEIAETEKAVNNANVAIYPVDARGLVADGRFSAEHEKVNLKPKMSMGPIVENQQTMEELASRTGGKAYYNTNDLSHAIHEAIEDASVTYTLGFYPEDEKYDGKFHKFNVKVEHSGMGYDVRFRKGYFDFENKPMDDKVRKQEISDAVLSPLDSSALGMVVQTRRTDKPAPNSMEMVIYLDPRGIGFEQKADRMNGKVDIFFVQKNDRGNQFNGKDDAITLSLTKDNYTKVMTSGLSYHQIVPLVAQATQLRIVARDDASGTLGSVTVPLRSSAGKSQPDLIRR